MSPKMTRRAALIGLTWTVALPGLVRANRLTDVDLVVIGAGAAGLEAARRAIALGRSVVVLEARDRTGGRAFTDTSAMGLPFDMGAHWLHGGANNPYLAMASDLGRKATLSNPESILFHRSGTRIPQDQSLNAIGKAYDRFERKLRWSDLRDDAAVATLEDGDEWLKVMTQITALSMATDTDRLSAHDAYSLEDGDDYVVEGGIGLLVADAGRALPVKVNHAVTGIDWSTPGRVIVSGDWGSLTGARCIVTVPTSVLAEDVIGFDPPLPVEKREAINATRCGQFMKIGLRLDRLEPGIPNYAFDVDAAQNGQSVAFYFDPVVPVATLLVSGRQGVELGRAPEPERVDYAISELAKILGTDVSSRVLAHATKNWMDDPWARGAYSVVDVGHANARTIYAEPLAGALYFAGEASGGSAAATVAGAHNAGRSAADAALSSL